MRIELKKPAQKFILAQERKQQARILKALNELPYCDGVKPMQGVPATFRLRIGSVRAIFTITDDTVIVLDIGNRGDVYK